MKRALVIGFLLAITGCSYEPYHGPAGMPLWLGFRNASDRPVRLFVDASTPVGPVYQPTIELAPGAVVRLEYEKSTRGPISGYASTAGRPSGPWVELVSETDKYNDERWFVITVDQETAVIRPSPAPDAAVR